MQFFNAVLTAVQRAAGATQVAGLTTSGAIVLSSGLTYSPVSSAVTAADIIADTAPASPGTWPNLTRFYISASGTGIDVGTEVVWIPTNHATLPASKGWRFAFYPSATVL